MDNIKNSSVGAVLAFAVVVLLLIASPATAPVGLDNSAIVTSAGVPVRRDCGSIVAPLDSLCESYQDPGERLCCDLVGQMIYSICQQGGRGSNYYYFASQYYDLRCGDGI